MPAVSSARCSLWSWKGQGVLRGGPLQNVGQTKGKVVLLRQNWGIQRNPADSAHRNLAKQELCSDLLLPGALRVKAAVGQHLKQFQLQNAILQKVNKQPGLLRVKRYCLCIEGWLPGDNPSLFRFNRIALRQQLNA